MDTYEELIEEVEGHIEIVEKCFKSKAKGLCKGNRVGINKKLRTTSEKACILAEEIGHYYTTVGNITDQSIAANRKQEKRARNWGYEHLVSLDKLISAYLYGVQGRYELAAFLDLSESFVQEAINHYREKYGLFVYHRGYIIRLENPVGVIENLDIIKKEVKFT